MNFSLEKTFLSKQNIKDISAYLGRDSTAEMVKWAKKKSLDDYEYISMDFSETLDFTNKEFIKEHNSIKETYTLNMSMGQKYPKLFIQDGVEYYNVNDWRTHDAQTVQEVFRSNKNFRYNNEIKKWETSLYKRNYDRQFHSEGLRDTRELNTLVRGYKMDDIFEKNPYESSNSIMYNY